MESLLKRYAKHFAYGVLVISVALMVYVIYELSITKKQFANQLITKSISQTESDLDHFFERITHLVLAVQHQYRSGFWSDLSTEKAILHGISLIDNYVPISSLGIADRRGYELNILPDTTAGQWLTRRVFVDQWDFIERWNRWKLSDSLTSLHHWEGKLSTDPRERPWFKGAVHAPGEVFWTNAYEYTTGPQIGITASIFLQNELEADSLSKIIAFDLTLNDLNRFVGDLQLTENQNIFLLTGDNSQVLALRRYSPNHNLAQLKSNLFLSPEELDNQTLIKVLKKEKNQTAFRFSARGKTWWGILKPYNISRDRTINIVSVLPEEDFATGITRTLWICIGSFFLILMLSLLVVWNHNKLHRISNILRGKNELISQQKRFLFSEVHHRVKNNLALVCAFLELELLNMTSPPADSNLRKHLQRVKIIAAIQEEAYQSQNLGSVPIKNLISSIINFQKDSAAETDFIIESENIDVNINQALSFGLLLNELLNRLIGQEEKSPAEVITIEINQKDSQVYTHLRTNNSHSTPEKNIKVLDEDIIKALSQQLDANVEMSFDDGIACKIEFELKEKKGVASSKHYKP